jgi:hypothetical protein
MGMDQVSNPQLKGGANLKRWKKLHDQLEIERKARQAEARQSVG